MFTIISGPARHMAIRSLARAILVASTLAPISSMHAQAPQAPARSWEFLASSGALVATGAERNTIKDAPLSTVQLSYVIDSRVAFTATGGWARSRDLKSADDARLDVFTVDLGAEYRAARLGGDEGMTLVPFIGAGAGSRSYNYRSLDVDATHNIAGYAALGGDVGAGRVQIRVEARDYVTGFKPLAGTGTARTQNDVVALVGLRFNRSGE